MVITFDDILLALVLTVLVVWGVRLLRMVFSMAVTRTTILGYHPDEKGEILKKCCLMFPIETLNFKGMHFRRGMEVQVVTRNKYNNTIVGEFVGTNQKNMLCVLTPGTVIAQEIENIEEIRVVK